MDYFNFFFFTKQPSDKPKPKIPLLLQNLLPNPIHSQILSLIKEKPERAIWWAKMESLDLSKQVSGNKQFSKNRPSYAEMLKFSKEQHDMFDQNEEAIPCFCGD